MAVPSISEGGCLKKPRPGSSEALPLTGANTSEMRAQPRQERRSHLLGLTPALQVNFGRRLDSRHVRGSTARDLSESPNEARLLGLA